MSKGIVLILDDSEIVLEASRLALEEAGYTAVTISSPFILVKTIERERPDLVLVDVEMPALNGDRVIEIASRAGAFKDAVVLLYSALPPADLEDMARRYGAYGFISKSTDPTTGLFADDFVSDVARFMLVARERRVAEPARLETLPPPTPVLIESASPRVEAKLHSTMLWRSGVERLMTAPDATTIFKHIRERNPRLLILDGRGSATPDLIQRIREQEDLRHISIAALVDNDAEDQEKELRRAGANVVLSEWQSTPTWDNAFRDLLDVPARRWARFPITLTVGPRPELGARQFKVVALNISQRGLLVESPWTLARGIVVHLEFELDAGPAVCVVGRVVWAQATDEGTTRHGIEFVGFYGDAMDRVAAFAPARASAEGSYSLSPAS